MDELAIFTRALDMVRPDQRAAFLQQACGADAPLRSRVEALLVSHDVAGSFLQGSPLASSPATIDQPLCERPSATIGPYKLLQQIGEGGMGTVYLAEQTEPVKRKVALKVIKPGMDTRQVIARFEAERQALAMMDHVNIARVLDAGTTEQNRPYFVMELVHGVPITKYCDDNHLTPRQRLELFVPVCQAIQHAHTKGIIHRDIKPSNVMVTLYDGKPVPKVIDFGVAKATEQRLTERTLFTQYGTMVGTLEYMSPEQAEMSALGVDTRSDIFSLGVLLYELLTGSTPLSHQRVRDAAYGEILRMIREEEPPKPSTRLSDSGEALASISAQRHTEPAKLAKLVRGELDWIVMKTLEKDRNRRYETANGFAADLLRYLNDEPVQACPRSTWYRLSKFARRNRAGLLTVSLLGAALLIATSAIGWTVRDRSAQQAEMERERAAARQQLEQERLLRQATLEDRIAQALDETKVGYERDRLPEALTAVKRAEALLASDSIVSSAMQQRVGQWRAELTILDRLEELAFHFSRDESRETDAAYSKVFLDIGINIDELSVEEAGQRIRSHLTWQRLTEALDRWTGVRHEIAALESFKDDASLRKQRLLQVARAADSNDLRSQARLAVEKWDLAAAERLAQLPEVSRLPASTLRQLAMVIYWGQGAAHRQARPAGALELLENARIQRPGDFQLNVACASYYMQMGPPQWAEAAHNYSIAIALRPDDARVQYWLAHVHSKEGKLNQAIDEYQRAIELDPKSAQAHSGLSCVLAQRGELDEAMAHSRKAIELDPHSALAHCNHGNLLYDQKRLDEAISHYRKAIELDPDSFRCRQNLGNALSAQGQWDEALVAFSKAIELNGNDATAWTNRGVVYEKQGQLDKARDDYSKAVELDPMHVTAWANRGLVYTRLDQPDKAIADYSRAIEIAPSNATAWLNRGATYGQLGQLDQALADYSKAIDLAPELVVGRYNRGLLYAKQGQLDKALVDFSKAIELDPTYTLAWNDRALVYARLGQVDKALADGSKTIELDPSNARACNYVALLLATCLDAKFRDPGRAVELAKQAIELTPKQGEYWRTLGLAHYRASSWKDSVLALQKSIELRQGGDASQWFCLAMAHWQLDQKDEAHQWYDRAVAWMDKNQEALKKVPFERELVSRFRAEAAELLEIKTN